MLRVLLNIFRKNKVFMFYPNASCSGSIPAISEFERFMDSLEKVHKRKIRMISCYGFMGIGDGFLRIKYEVSGAYPTNKEGEK